jgi:hypothetical protein
VPEDNSTAISLIQRLAEQEFWGNIALKFQHGAVIHITKEESLKPTQTAPEYRRKHDNSSTC